MLPESPRRRRPRIALLGATVLVLIFAAALGSAYGASAPAGVRGRLQVELDRPARLALTVSTEGCRSRTLVVRVDGKVQARRTIRKPRELVTTGSLPAGAVSITATTPGCGGVPTLSYRKLSAAAGEDPPVDPSLPSAPGSSASSVGSTSPSVATPGAGTVGLPEAPVPTLPESPLSTLPESPVSTPPVTTPPPVTSPEPEPTPPADPAERFIPVGTAVASRFLDAGDPRYAQTVVENFQSVTPEVEMKWEYTEPAEGEFNFAPAEEVVDFAEEHGLAVRGHTLVWEQELPHWLNAGTWTRPELEAILRRHIQTEVSHFAGRVPVWDVVNEPFENDGTLKPDIFSEVIGPDYIALALRWAHEADPSASLYINDYNVDWDGPKQDAMVALVERLKAEGVAVDGIGMEEHLSLEWSPTETQMVESMRRFEALGLDVEVTEMDVGTRESAGSEEEVLDAQAEVFAAAARACRAAERCMRFSVWGVSDAVSWLGAEEAGLPFSDEYEAKPAWLAIQRNLANP